MANKTKKKVTKTLKQAKKTVTKEVKQVKKDAAQVKKDVTKKVEDRNKLRARDYRRRAINITKPMRGDFAVVYFVYAVILAALGGIVGGISMIDPMTINPRTGEITGTGIGMSIASAIAGLFALLTTGAFIFSFIQLAKQARKTGAKPTVGGLFYGFKERYTQSLGVYIMTTIFTVLWSLLLIIPGIIKSYCYAMSQYIALDNPGKSTLDCITESRKLMKGHKWQLFCLQISHIGWFILVILTLGILSFWVLPKYQQAIYEFYLHISHKD